MTNIEQNSQSGLPLQGDSISIGGDDGGKGVGSGEGIGSGEGMNFLRSWSPSVFSGGTSGYSINSN